MNQLLPPTTPRLIRQNNAAAALSALFDRGRLSRAGLARELGLNRSSSGHIVADLVANGLVREVEDEAPRIVSPARAGRPGILLELVAETAVFVGAEIGVEHITTLAIDLSARIAACRVVPFDGRAVPAEAAVALAVAQALADLPADALDRVEGFGLAAPAQIDRIGTVRIAPLLGWRDVDLAGLARRTLPLDVPVAIDNDANAFAFGESYRDPVARLGVTLFLVIETGVGGAIMIDGDVFRGGHGLAGEVGHLPLDGGGELEEVLGLASLLARHGSRSIEEFVREVAGGVPAALAIAEDWARHLARAIVAAGRLVDPGRVVLGGSVAALYPLVAASICRYIAAAQAPTFPIPSIAVHEGAETGPAYGAACMMHRRFLLAGQYAPIEADPDLTGGPR